MNQTGDHDTDQPTDADPESDARGLAVDPKLLEILVCPVSHGPLRYDREAQELISETAGLAYPVRDGIPIMLADEARRLDETKPAPTASP